VAFYQCGTCGPEVGIIQAKLKEKGTYNGPVDGDFGGGTESAVKAFQRSAGLAADGVVGILTWDELFGGESRVKEPAIRSSPLTVRCLALTGSFECKGAPPESFAELSGDFDGQGLSLGVCQWNIGQGELQPLLTEMAEAYSVVVNDTLHDHAVEFRTMLASSREEQMAWARSLQDGRHRIAEPWAGLLKTLARTEEFQSIQVAASNRTYQAALALCGEFGLTTERAVALMFDIKIQNGNISDVVKAQIERDFAHLSAPPLPQQAEVARLQIVANRRSAASDPRWREDVRVRKLTIANGTGTVHGRGYDLDAQYGIGLHPF
jgi:peptidoglycan hydrolase-like protein with peptidoglycan-binding domain